MNLERARTVLVGLQAHLEFDGPHFRPDREGDWGEVGLALAAVLARLDGVEELRKAAGLVVGGAGAYPPGLNDSLVGEMALARLRRAWGVLERLDGASVEGGA